MLAAHLLNKDVQSHGVVHHNALDNARTMMSLYYLDALAFKSNAHMWDVGVELVSTSDFFSNSFRSNFSSFCMLIHSSHYANMKFYLLDVIISYYHVHSARREGSSPLFLMVICVSIFITWMKFNGKLSIIHSYGFRVYVKLALIRQSL